MEEWKTTYSLDINEIPKAILALSKAYEYLVPDLLSKFYITFFKVPNRNQNFL